MMNQRGVTILFMGIVLMGISYGLEFVEQVPRWTFNLALLGWCVAAFGLGVLYRDYVKRIRERRARRGHSEL
jgi:hypothetical protein